MKLHNIILIAGAVIAASSCGTASSPENFTQYVNTRIGSGGHGHVFVGANVPFGAVQLGPTSVPVAWDWTSGYHNSDSTVIGFSHTHFSGTGIGDLFDVTVMPVIGDVKYSRGILGDPESGLWSYADRSQEVTVPGYYKVPLTRYGITAEMTATSRVGLHRYTFPASEEAAIVFDLENGGCWDKATKTFVEKVDETTLRGYRFSEGWAKNQKVFFYAQFSKPFSSFEVCGENGMYGRADFTTTEGEQILVKVGISAVSEDGARKNVAAELPGWDFEAVRTAADMAWNKELSKVRIETADETRKTIFYTAMYHTMIAPSVYNDVDGAYRGSDDQIHENADFTNYTTFSLWDTYRAAMPLFTILHPEKMDDVVKTMVHISKEGGKIPVWHFASCENDCMVGNPGVIVVSDAIVKGFKGFDQEDAFGEIKKSLALTDRGQDLRQKYGFIPSDLYNESVASDMEYAIADGAAANAAHVLGKTEDEAYYRERSHSYRNYLDPETLLARGKMSDGTFRTPFDPFYSMHRENDYCEGNAWQYTWLAPQDFDGLVSFYGSNEKFLAQLDTLFCQSEELTGDDASPDISGLIGQYVHGNEPSHHIIYFYTMAGEPWKAADKLREVFSTMYFNDDNGLPGNEDVGQMSGWYILSTLGFYQVEPASTRFYFGSPLHDKAEIKVAGGKFTIEARNNSDENRYIQSITLNDKPYDKPYIEFSDIYRGGRLVFEMGKTPVRWW